MFRLLPKKNNSRAEYTPRYSLKSAVIASDLLFSVLTVTYISSILSTGLDIDRLAGYLITLSVYVFWRFK
jgi:hypothetical protein